MSQLPALPPAVVTDSSRIGWYLDHSAIDPDHVRRAAGAQGPFDERA
jgi:hypothetical protein